VGLPAGVKVVDYGIRGMHLAYDLASGFDSAILVDATPRGGEPGTIYVIEPELGPQAAAEPAAGAALAGSPLLDAHGMQPDVVFGMLDMLDGERPGRILVVGCEPATVDYGMGLSDAVAASVDEAVRVVLELVASGGGSGEQQQEAGWGAQGAGGPTDLIH
jgi:hydrogenase maturation protease